MVVSTMPELWFPYSGQVVEKPPQSSRNPRNLQSAIYSIVLLGIFNRFNVGLHDIYDALLSALNGKYWFVTVYIVLYIFHQYINTCLRNISQQQFKKLIILSFVLWILFPGIFRIDMGVGTSMIPYGIMMYSLGAYLQLYPAAYEKHKTISILLLLIVIRFVLFLIIDNTHLHNGLGDALENQLCTVTSITMFGMSISLFTVFQNLHMKLPQLFTTISKTSLGVYLIHNNEYAKNFIWIVLFNNQNRSYDSLVVLALVFESAVVFAICATIDTIYEFILKYTINRMRFKHTLR